jgi:mono/diheme cytochrome c family protein
MISLHNGGWLAVKIVKRLVIVLGVLAAAIAGFALYVDRSGIPHYPPGSVELKVEATPARVEHGKKIVSMLCASCHLDPATERLTGRRMPDVPPQFGIAYSKNITGHKTRGIGSWTDGEIAYVLRTGIARDGRYIPPYMVKLPNASDEDIAAIVAFLRSDDPLVAPSDAPNMESQPSFLTKVLSRTVFKPFEYPTAPLTAPDPGDRVAHGRYLVANLGCFSCHSADFATVDDLHPEKSKGYFGGGNAMLDANGRTIVTANITLDRETGIGAWTEDQFVHAVRAGFRPDNSPIRYPMQMYVELDEGDVRAIYAYLQTVPPIHNPVPRTPDLAAVAGSGEAIYHKYACQSCHGETGVGLCDLRKAHQKYAADADLIAFVKDPSRTDPGSKMPSWGGVIDEGDYPALVAYVRKLGGAAR